MFMDVGLLNESVPYISQSLAIVIDKSFECVFFDQDYRTSIEPSIHKYDGDINDEKSIWEKPTSIKLRPIAIKRCP